MSKTAEPETGLGFDDPPPKREPRYDWEAIAKAARRRPGKWYAVFKQDRTTFNTAIKAGKITALRPDRGFETRTANNKIRVSPRLCDLWVRYVPENDTTKESK